MKVGNIKNVSKKFYFVKNETGPHTAQKASGGAGSNLRAIRICLLRTALKLQVAISAEGHLRNM